MSGKPEPPGMSRLIVKIIPFSKLLEDDAEGTYTELFNDLIDDMENQGWGLEDVKTADAGERWNSNSSGGLIVIFVFWRPKVYG